MLQLRPGSAKQYCHACRPCGRGSTQEAIWSVQTPRLSSHTRPLANALWHCLTVLCLALLCLAWLLQASRESLCMSCRCSSYSVTASNGYLLSQLFSPCAHGSTKRPYNDTCCTAAAVQSLPATTSQYSQFVLHQTLCPLLASRQTA